jgi:hypothetical protein
MKAHYFFALLFAAPAFSFAQNVGIGTITPNPTAVLHVNAGTNFTQGLLVTGNYNSGASIPDLGDGSRLMFYPGKGAFRAGYVQGSLWNNSNVGNTSVGLGYNTQASGSASTAMGNSTEASGIVSTAMGYLTIASGNTSTAMGGNTEAKGTYSTAMGSSTIASGNSSTAMGISTIASGYASTAIGNNSVAKAFSGVAIGQFNDATDAPSQDNPLSADRIFQIGNGNGEETRSNAVTVLRNGNTGIGLLDPAYRLELAGRMRIRSGANASTSAGVWLNRNDNSGLLGFIGVDGNNDIGIFSSASNWSFLVNTTNGNAWVKGTVTANGVTLTSDERLKKDITPLGAAMPLLEKLNGYQYHWKDETWDATLQTGLLAQEVEKVLPELVKTDDKGMKSVNYIGLMPYLL